MKPTNEELRKEIEEFEDAYNNWNNKELNNTVRENANKIVDKMTEERRDPTYITERLKGRQEALAEVEKIIDETTVEFKDVIDSDEQGVSVITNFKERLKQKIRGLFPSVSNSEEFESEELQK